MTDFGRWVDIIWPAAYNPDRYELSKRQPQAEQEGEAEQQLLVWLVAFPRFFVNPERAAGPAARFLFLAIYRLDVEMMVRNFVDNKKKNKRHMPDPHLVIAPCR